MTEQEHAICEIGVAVDVGSTSIAVCCIDLIHKTEMLSFSFTNPQHVYGADVITRVKHCVDEPFMLQKLHMLVEKELHAQLQKHLKECYSSISTFVYSGNTVMLHILQELSIEGLAQAPFQPMNLEYVEKILINDDVDAGNRMCSLVKNIYLPGFSAFVGADILSGASYIQMGNDETYELLIDLGTNGELLLLNKEKGFASSTACGPVFDHVISGSKYGSDSMKVIANCVRRGLIDRTGKLADSVFEKGISIDKNFIVKQENIRNFQLAKGAIYAGIQCLLEKAHITVQDISKVYISGGFGFYMDIRDAFTLKMLQKELKDKVEILGNTSLEGAKQWLLAKDTERKHILKKYQAIKQRTQSFELSNFDCFQDYYIQALDF